MPERWLSGTEHLVGEVLPAVPEKAVNTVPVVNVVGAEEGLVVGQDDILVLSFPAHTPHWELMELRRLLLEAGLRQDQFVLIGGFDTKMAKVPRERPAIDPGE